jgi:MFS family permease
VIAARVVQGVATGAATSAFAAALSELAPTKRKRLAALLGSLAPAAGLAIGCFLTGIAVQFAPRPNTIVFGVLAAVMVASIGVIFMSPETAPGLGGSISFRPVVRIPSGARAEFIASVPVNLSGWAFAGLYLSLIPSIIRSVFDLNSGFLNGSTSAIEPGAAAVLGLVAGSWLSGRTTVALGGASIILGSVLTVLGVTGGGLGVILLAAAIGGVGFGASFSGSIRIILPLAVITQRAELLTALYLVGFVGFGVPVLVAGQLLVFSTLSSTVVGYCVACATLAAIGLGGELLVVRRQRTQMKKLSGVRDTA